MFNSETAPKQKNSRFSLHNFSPTIIFTTVCDSKHFICHLMGLTTFCLSLNKLNILSPSLDWEHKWYVSHLCLPIGKKKNKTVVYTTQMLNKYSLKWTELLNFFYHEHFIFSLAINIQSTKSSILTLNI